MTTQTHPNSGNTTHKTSKTVGTRVYALTVTEYANGDFRGVVTYQPINPRTGNPWQATRLVFSAEGEQAPALALAVYLKVAE